MPEIAQWKVPAEYTEETYSFDCRKLTVLTDTATGRVYAYPGAVREDLRPFPSLKAAKITVAAILGIPVETIEYFKEPKIWKGN